MTTTRTMMTRNFSLVRRWACGFMALLLVAAGCRETPTHPSTVPGDSAARQMQSALTGGDLVTSNPTEFAAALEAIGNENEILVVLKDVSQPRISRQFLLDSELMAPLRIAIPATPQGSSRRADWRIPDASPSAHTALTDALSSIGLDPYRKMGSVYAVRIPDEKLSPAFGILLNHPNVDYIEANQKRPVKFASREAGATVVAPLASPIGTNPIDFKHEFHNVADSDGATSDAWDITRGYGASLGIMDSGFAGSSETSWHPDGQLLSRFTGISKLGFSDDYDDCDYEITGEQSVGECPARDDEGHGTNMAGLAGANDNNINVVGIMPEGLTASMKIAQNCRITGCSPSDDEFVIEDDDMYWAIRWAEAAGIEVLAMSFTTVLGATSLSELSTAFNNYDILLMAATGGSGNSEPASLSFVMGVGGVTSSGTNVDSDFNQEVSALAGGRTLKAACSGTDWCTPDGDMSGGDGVGAGGSSASTAIAASIAAMVRANEPALSAQQTRQRLVLTAEGPHSVVNAWRALADIPPPTVDIQGETTASAHTTYTWDALTVGGKAPLSYTWYRNGALVGSSDSYTASSGDTDFVLIAEVEDAQSTVAADTVTVTVTSCGQPIC